MFQTTVWQDTFQGVAVYMVHLCLMWCSFCCWKADVHIPALSVESPLHLDLGSQGCPGPVDYHLNHTLISPPCTLCCWINRAISFKQLLLPSCSHLLSCSGYLSPRNRKVHTRYSSATPGAISFMFSQCEQIHWMVWPGLKEQSTLY